jgi:hypothetical protein
VPLTGSAQAEDEPPPANGDPCLVGVIHDTGIEQSGRFEGILVQEIRADQAALVLRKSHVSRKGSFHLGRARFESLSKLR